MEKRCKNFRTKAPKKTSPMQASRKLTGHLSALRWTRIYQMLESKPSLLEWTSFRFKTKAWAKDRNNTVFSPKYRAKTILNKILRLTISMPKRATRKTLILDHLMKVKHFFMEILLTQKIKALSKNSKRLIIITFPKQTII